MFQNMPQINLDTNLFDDFLADVELNDGDSHQFDEFFARIPPTPTNTSVEHSYDSISKNYEQQSPQVASSLNTPVSSHRYEDSSHASSSGSNHHQQNPDPVPGPSGWAPVRNLMAPLVDEIQIPEGLTELRPNEMDPFVLEDLRRSNNGTLTSENIHYTPYECNGNQPSFFLIQFHSFTGF